jgi:hypothetical protein
MPVRDRKFYIAKHNGIVEEENRSRHNSEVNGTNINDYAKLEQTKEANAKRRK